MRTLTAAEAAKRLGVKVETVYAYVSRGVLRSTRAADSRSSLFDAADVEAIALRGRPRRVSRRLTFEVEIDTHLTEIDGHALRFRGHDAVKLATSATFEQVAELLWTGALPERGRWLLGPLCRLRSPRAAAWATGSGLRSTWRRWPIPRGATSGPRPSPPAGGR